LGLGTTRLQLQDGPSTEQYGALATVGSAAAAFQVVVANAGDAPTGPISIRLAGSGDTQFRITDDECSSRSLNPGSNCNVHVAFAPTEPGVFHALFSATARERRRRDRLAERGGVTVHALAPNPRLRALAAQRPGSAPDVYRHQPIHCARRPDSRLAHGQRVLDLLRRLHRPGPGAAARCDINVVITPNGDRNDGVLDVSVIDRSGELLVWSNLQGYGSPWLVPASGTDPVMQAPFGTTINRTFTLVNTGPSSVGPISTRLTWYPYESNPFSLVRDACNGHTLGAGATCTVDVSFTADGTIHFGSILADTLTGGEGSIGLIGRTPQQ